MLVYSGIKTDFLHSVEEDTIADEIKKTILEKMAYNDFIQRKTDVSQNEV